MPQVQDLAAAAEWVGREVGLSDWIEISQQQVDQFANTTGDQQFIHIDPARAAAETPFGGTIAHGFLTLSLLSQLGADAAMLRFDNTRMMINYGLDRVRFINPVRVGARIRARFELLSAEQKSPGQMLLKHRATVEIEGEEKPAMIAEWLGMAVLSN